MEKYYVAYEDQSMLEAIESHETHYDSEVDAVSDTLTALGAGAEFFIITAGLARLSFYRIVETDGKLFAERITDGGKELKPQAEKSDRDVLFELVTALYRQKEVKMSIAARMKLSAARAHLEAKKNVKQ
jgi:hypothetical protein